MVRVPGLSAQQRFARAARVRAQARARRQRIAIALLAPFGLASCVVPAAKMHPVAIANALPAGVPVVEIAPVAAVSETMDAPVVAGIEQGPSLLAGIGERDRLRASLCLASAIYYEAATEPDEGQRAVAQVVLNRVRHPGWPNSVCGVVYQGSNLPGCQFSFACDGAMARKPMLSAWIRARRVAERALAGDVYTPVGSSTFYHTMAVAPAWRLRLTPTAIVGAHIFYRQPGDAADAQGLPGHYWGGEPTPGPLPRTVSFADLARLKALPEPVAIAPVQTVTLSPAAVAPTRAVPLRNDDRYVAGVLPDSNVRPEYRDSGQWIAPAR